MDPETFDLGTPFLRLERRDHLAWCTIDRPRSRNALSPAMYYGIKRAVEWGNMSLPELLQQIVRNEGELTEIDRLLQLTVKRI